MKRLYKFSLLILVAFTVFSCKPARQLNTDYENPAKPGKYPRFGKEDYLHGTYGEFRKNNDVFFYELNIDVDIENKSLSGWVDMHFKALEDLQTIQIDLVKKLKITSIEQNGQSLKFDRDHRAVFVHLAASLSKGQTTVIRTYYEGVPDPAKRPPWKGGLDWSKTKSGDPWVGVACEGIGPSVWWPVKDHLLDEPDSVLMHITLPEGLFCVGNGRLQKREIDNGKETFTWKTSYNINTYNVTFYAAKYEHFQLPYPEGDTTYYLDFYVLPENLDTAKTHFKQSIEIIRYFEKIYGEYPWWRDGFKLVESPYAGMEHQTAIAYGNRYKNESEYNYDHIILHEAVHEWWGNSVSAYDYAEIWLHEGFATYSEALFLESVYGKKKYFDHLRFYSYRINNKYPLIGPYDVNFWVKEDGDVYFKGALMLHTLRNVLNDDTLFFNIIKTFYDTNKYNTATTAGFIKLVKEKTGKDYGWFFDVYLYDRKCPRLDFSYMADLSGSGNTLKYQWANVPDSFKVPIEITINGKKQLIQPSNKVQSLKIGKNSKVRLNTGLSYITYVENRNL